jgi:UDP-N-acetylmuramoyl-L-alanyl-D-glutamate--2,6-diaminopimelate ligase
MIGHISLDDSKRSVIVMKLSALLQDVPVLRCSFDAKISGLTFDTRNLTSGNLFFCVRGGKTDGHDLAQTALDLGAAAVVCEKDMGLAKQILVQDTRAALAVCAANWFGNPQKDLTMIGVTGTNGKTTVTYLIRDILRGAGYKTGLIGTIETEIDGQSFPAKYTTPDPMTLFGLLAEMRLAGCSHVVMEVSSHGLEQHRVDGCRFAVAVFTNLTQDHLDYHGTMDNYYAAKRRLFLQSDAAILNADDSYGQKLAGEVTCSVKTYSVVKDEADYTAKSLRLHAQGSAFAFVGSGMIERVSLPIPGEFSVQNAMAAIAACLGLGVGLPKACSLLSQTSGVPGRFQVLRTGTPCTVIRDYAHTPDAITKVLTALRMVTQGRIVILFGCAGRRDREKRSKMASAASKLADYVILTSDNPRDEDVMQIIEDAKPGLAMHPTPFQIIPDRYDAIRWALENAKEGDVLLLAGKGHEDCQVLKHAAIQFDEAAIVEEILEDIQNAHQADENS